MTLESESLGVLTSDSRPGEVSQENTEPSDTPTSSSPQPLQNDEESHESIEPTETPTSSSPLLTKKGTANRCTATQLGWHTLFFVMHVLLVVMHLCLLIVRNYGAERRVRVALGTPTTTLSNVISLISQTFAIVYLAALLYITQKLSLRQILRSEKTITGIHDRQTAWSSLGSAINALWNQISIPSSVWGVSTITVYLALTAGLKITTPALLRLVPVNQTVSFTVNSTVSDPYSLALTYPYDPSLHDDAAHIAASLLNRKDTDNTFGLGRQGNMLYDVVDLNPGSGSMNVNSYIMNVTCGKVPMSLIATHTSKFDVATIPAWDIKYAYGPDLMVETSFPLVAPNVLNLNAETAITSFTSFNTMDSATWPNHTVIYPIASFNVTDSEDDLAPQIALDPPMNPMINAGFFLDNGSTEILNSKIIRQLNFTDVYNFNVSSVAFFGCSLSIINSSVLIDPRTRIPLESLTRKTLSVWKDLKVNSGLSEFSVHDMWLTSMYPASATNVTVSTNCNDSVGAIGNLELPACTYMSQSERFILDKLSISPSTNMAWILPDRISQPEPVDVANVKLHDFENAIEDYTAAFFWSISYLQRSPTFREVLVPGVQMISELQLNALAVVAGLIFSAGMLVLAPVLVGFKSERHDNKSVEGLGILEILWLAGAGDEISAVEKPSSKHLRKAGMSVSALSRYRPWVDKESE